MEWLLLAHGHGDSCDFSRHSGRGLDFHCFLSILTQKAERRMLAPCVSVRQRDKKQCPVLTMAVSHLFPFEVTAPQRRLCSTEGGAGIWLGAGILWTGEKNAPHDDRKVRSASCLCLEMC